MERIDVFPTQVWINTTDNIDNDALTEFILNEEKTSDNVNSGYNRFSASLGSWQSHAKLLDDFIREIPETIFGLDNLIKESTKEIILYNEYKETVKIKYEGMWANINRYKDYNTSHVHPYSDWSGCYYVKTPENCGSIRFADPRTVRHMLAQPHLYNLNQCSSERQGTEYRVLPKAGRLVMFPSFLEHQVEPNQSQELRISISFNLGLS